MLPYFCLGAGMMTGMSALVLSNCRLSENAKKAFLLVIFLWWAPSFLAIVIDVLGAKTSAPSVIAVLILCLAAAGNLFTIVAAEREDWPWARATLNVDDLTNTITAAVVWTLAGLLSLWITGVLP